MTRTDRRTSGCWSRECRCSVSDATSARAIRRRSTTTRRCKRACVSLAAAVCNATRTSTARTLHPGTRFTGSEKRLMPKVRASAIFALLLVSVLPAAAQDLTPAVVSPQVGGSVDLGGGLLNLVGDAARDQRYRDLRSGFVMDCFG